jgi:class 3 adenylate cyclase
VFQLLETVYQAFDKIAAQFGVFKIETIGDCYVAVAGLPVFQPDHAVHVVKFAYECVIHMHQLLHELEATLEATLGPSTSSLSIRVGVHSGPVIAGVLRGEKSRFQLFGDTMNTTARM